MLSAVALTAAAAVGVFVGGQDVALDLAHRSVETEPLKLGLSSEQQALVETLQSGTGPEARILWEDDVEPGRSHWTALMPLLTDRAFLGGLDAEAGIEHLYPSLVEEKLAGRHISSWTDAELDDFCRRYNVGWVVCRSPANVQRFRTWAGAAETLTLPGPRTATFFTLQRRPHSFALKGKAQLVHADSGHLTLTDVVPKDGVVVLSFHYQSGMRATPASVCVEREPDALDPVALVRLRLNGPVACVTLTWDGQ
jgi:hypothetical protein